MRKSKIGGLLGLVVLIGLIGCIAYNVYDNHRFIVVEQEVGVERLPASFDGFRILQISDLHGRYFGERQADLIEAINQLDYDMIAFTGDMNASYADNSTASAQAVLDLLDGIENKEAVFWVDGNAGPYATESTMDAKTGALNEIGTILQEKGCQVLLLPVEIRRGAERIWITPEMSEMVFEAVYRSRSGVSMLSQGAETDARIRAFYETAYEAYQSILDNGEVKIMLTHTPKQVNLSAEELEPIGDLDYDLILAGHYHGGQIRLPWIGALYIPSPTTGLNNYGFFPPQNEVKGISYYGDVPQYISAGLGSSGNVRFLAFRLFDTPEINLITLTRAGK